MTMLLFHHDACLAHDPGPDHSERALRLERILEALRDAELPATQWIQMPRGKRADIARVHTEAYIDFVRDAVPSSGYREIEVNDVISDDDGGEVTVLCPHSGEAVLRSVGGVTAAVDAILAGGASRAFCATRPPGHHALPDKAMGFCVFNNVAIAARRALRVHGLRKVAIVDFDVHHGNGTQAIFERDSQVFYASVHQLPLWPETGAATEIGCGNILNAPVPPGASRQDWLCNWQDRIMTRLEAEKPDMLMISAGFDAHKDDPKGRQNLETEDYATITRDLLAYADRTCGGRVLSVLEGGYDIDASAAGARAHVETMASWAGLAETYVDRRARRTSRNISA